MHQSEEKDFKLVLTADLLDKMPNGVVTWTRDSRPLYCNKNFLDMFQIKSIDEYLEKLLDLMPPRQPNGEDSCKLRQAYFEKAFAEGMFRFEWIIKDLEGELSFFDCLMLKSEFKGEETITSFLSDIKNFSSPYDYNLSTLRNAHKIYDKAPIGITVFDSQFKLIDCNMGLIKLLDLESKKEYLDKSHLFYEELQPNGMLSADLRRLNLRKAFEDGSNRFFWTFRKLNGETIPTEITLIKSFDGDKPIVFSYIHDLRELVKSQEKLRETEIRSQLMLDATPLCANFWEREYVGSEVVYRNVDCNLEALELFGVASKEEYLARFYELSTELQDGIPTDIVAKRELVKAFSEGYSRFEWMHQNLKKELIPAEITLKRVEYGNNYYVIGFTRDLREIKAIEAKRQEAEMRAKMMLDATPLCAYFWERDYSGAEVNYKITDCNLEALSLFALNSKEEFLKRFYDLSADYQGGFPVRQAAKNHLNTAFLEGYDKFEWMHIGIRGEEIPVEIILKRVKYGDTYYVIGYTKDLREIRASETLLKQSEERISALLDTFPMGAEIWDKNYNLIDCNLECVRMVGYNSKEEYITNFFSLLPITQPNGISSRQFMIDRFDEAFSTGYNCFEFIFLNCFGEQIPLEVTLIRTKIRDEDFVAVYHRDLREIKASLKKTREAEDRIKTMLDSFPMGAIFIDQNYNFVDCNMETVKLFGFSDKSSYLTDFAKAFPPYQACGTSSYLLMVKYLCEAFETGYQRFEWMNKHVETDEPIPIEITLVRTKHYDEFAIICYVRDLREFKTMLKEIKIVEDDLRKARDDAEQSAKVKSEFLANMSHEIRTPMHGILGLLRLLEETELEPIQKNYVNNSLVSAENLMRIINDILDFSKIEAGKMELELIPFKMEDIAVELKNLFEPKAKEKGLDFIVKACHCDQIMICGDPTRLKQVLFNLVSNAIKFTENGNVRVEWSCDEIEGDSIEITYSVTDTGIGLTEEQQSKLFSAFTQADSSITRKFGGTGLGLAISKNIVEMFGGQIWIKSTRNEGATFYFTAVFEKFVENTNDENFVKPKIDISTIKFEGQVLLVEDNKINQMIAVELIKKVGLVPQIANNGQEAIDMLEKQDFDLVLMDIQMPVMDGLTATRIIRENDKFKNLPIIAMSANAMVGDKEISLQHGMNDHICKPISPELLYNSIDFWLIQNKK